MVVIHIFSEQIKWVVLSLLMMLKRIWKRMAFIWDTCLWGKVWKVGKRTLMVLSMVFPIVVLSHGGLRVAPDNEWNKLSSFHYHGLKSIYLGFDLSLLCFKLIAMWRLLWSDCWSNRKRTICHPRLQCGMVNKNNALLIRLGIYMWMFCLTLIICTV